ncbi:MAG: methionyl-tRNA formyltransferase [Lachnospiraceae bacterium]|nr:methionyl-tRNA formyltransferase [Lachnospiraceae bacterium]
MKVIFMGTPDFAVPVLQGLIEAKEHEVTAVITQPDKARGRSGKLIFTPVKQVAVENNIPVYTPKRVKDAEFVKELKTIPCDVIVVVAFGQILSKEILECPKYGCINVHASLLPRWRGAAPMQWAILAGDKKTGITTMQMDEGLDTGDMLLRQEVEITPEETGESLHDKMAVLGSGLLLETLAQAAAGTLQPVAQKEEESTYAKMLTKELGRLDFSKEAEGLERYIRGLNSWPSAYTGLRGKTLKIWKAEVTEEETGCEPGTVVSVGKDHFTVQTGKGCLRLLEVQLEGKKRMDAGSFLRGVKIEKGDILCI